MRRIHQASVALAACVLTGAATASDLKLDGQTVLNKAIGTNLQIDLTGNPGLPTLLALDGSPGPVSLFGESVPLGLTPALRFLPSVATNGSGVASTTTAVPSIPALIGSTFYLVGMILDPVDPNGFDFSNGASVTLTLRPFFEKVRAINLGSSVEVSIDPLAMPALAGKTVDIYVTVAKSKTGWDANATLTDVSSGGAETVAFSSAGVQANTFTVDTGTLAGPTGTDLGAGYDVVIDVDQNGMLSAGDVIDGYSIQPGFTVVRDTTQLGPYAVTEQLYTGGTWLG